MIKHRSGLFMACAVIALSLSSPLRAQFSYDVVDDNRNFELEKPLSFYWTPRYNRVEGVFLNIGARWRPQSMSQVIFYGDIGGGFWNQANKQVRFTAGFRKDFFEFERLSFGAEVFRQVESEDDWTVGNVENTLASLLFREDYKDYYGSHGFKVFVDHRFKGVHTLRFEVERRTFDAFKRNINWSLFKGDFDSNPTRPNSFLVEGDEIGFKFISAFDWRDNPIFPLSGWFVEAIYERTIEDFHTDGLFLTVKRFHQTFGNQRVNVRAMIGARRGDDAAAGKTSAGDSLRTSLADQYTIDIGGIGSLRGFDDKEFTGNRMFMLNANYLFSGDVLQKIPLQNVPYLGAFWTTLSLGVFLDTGWAWNTGNLNDGLWDGFGKLTFDNLKTNIGLSILLLEGVFRLDVAKRLDRSDNDFRVTFRLLEKF
ncbi:MAG: hypothetical protein ACE5HS_00590 [bacterium]